MARKTSKPTVDPVALDEDWDMSDLAAEWESVSAEPDAPVTEVMADQNFAEFDPDAIWGEPATPVDNELLSFSNEQLSEFVGMKLGQGLRDAIVELGECIEMGTKFGIWVPATAPGFKDLMASDPYGAQVVDLFGADAPDGSSSPSWYLFAGKDLHLMAVLQMSTMDRSGSGVAFVSIGASLAATVPAFGRMVSAFFPGQGLTEFRKTTVDLIGGARVLEAEVSKSMDLTADKEIPEQFPSQGILQS